MGYSSVGRKPFERASKSSHHHLINDQEIQAALKSLDMLSPFEDKLAISSKVDSFVPEKDNKISKFIAIDGGYTEIKIRSDFPSALIHFFQLGALNISRDDLQKLKQITHIAPAEMAKLKNNINRLKLVLPAKGMCGKEMSSRQETVRLWIHKFFTTETLGEDSNLLETLKWFVFRRYKQGPRTDEERTCKLTIHPLDQNYENILLHEDDMRLDGTFICSATNETLYLTDIFMFHEVIDEDETNAIGLCGYLVGIIEHIIAIHIIRHLLIHQPEDLAKTLFIMDRPTVFFGQTEKLRILMENLINWLFDHYQIYWLGIEKSGAFVDHAHEIRNLMPNSSFLVLGDSYIYRHISAGKEQQNRSYADTSYYGHKVIFKTSKGQIHVVSVPVRKLKKEPTYDDLPNLKTILTNIEELHCNMYDSALIPIILINKLVSLSTHPSSKILKSFAKSSINETPSKP